MGDIWTLFFVINNLLIIQMSAQLFDEILEKEELEIEPIDLEAALGKALSEVENI